MSIIPQQKRSPRAAVTLLKQLEYTDGEIVAALKSEMGFTDEEAHVLVATVHVDNPR